MYEQYQRPGATPLQTNVYEWDGEKFGDMIFAGDIVEISVPRYLKSKPYDDSCRGLTRGVVFLKHGEFLIDIDNPYSRLLTLPMPNERVGRVVYATSPRHLSNYSVDIMQHKPYMLCSACRNIRILGNIYENPELIQA